MMLRWRWRPSVCVFVGISIIHNFVAATWMAIARFKLRGIYIDIFWIYPLWFAWFFNSHPSVSCVTHSDKHWLNHYWNHTLNDVAEANGWNRFLYGITRLLMLAILYTSNCSFLMMTSQKSHRKNNNRFIWMLLKTLNASVPERVSFAQPEFVIFLQIQIGPADKQRSKE